MKRILTILIAGIILMSFAVTNTGAMIEPYWYGDVNNDREIDILDATQIQLFLAGYVELEPLSAELADVDADMEVSVLDATAIQMYVAKLIDEFPQRSNGLYTLLDLRWVGANFDSGKAMVGVPVTFSPFAYAYAEVAKPEYKLTFLENSVADVGTVLHGDVMTYTFDTAGVYYLELVAYNKFGEEERYSFEYEVTDKVSDELIVSAIYENHLYLNDMTSASFTAYAYGGSAPYEYQFENVYGNVWQEYSESNTFSLDRWGYYPAIVVRVKDADGNVAVSKLDSYPLYDAVPA